MDVVWSPGFVHGGMAESYRHPTFERDGRGEWETKKFGSPNRLYETRWDLPVTGSTSEAKRDRDAARQCRIGNQQGHVGGEGIGVFGTNHR